MISEQWFIPLTIIGLLLLLLFMASLVSKYQNHRANLRAVVRRVGAAIPLIEEALEHLSTVPLSQPLRLMLRGDIYSRLKAIRGVCKSYPNIVERLEEAKLRVDREGAATAKSVPPIKDERHLQNLIRSVDNLVDFIEQGGPMNHQRTDLRVAFRDELTERRAEILARYHMVQASRYQQANNINTARNHLNTLLRVLEERGPNTEFVRELHGQATKMIREVNATKQDESGMDSTAA